MKKTPQKPYTTLGMAASSSIRNDDTRRTQPDTISDRKAAAPTPSGTAMIMAMIDVSRVPTMNGTAPYWFVFESQTVPTKRDRP